MQLLVFSFSIPFENVLQQIHICKEEHAQKMGKKTHSHNVMQAALNAQIKSHADVRGAYATQMAQGDLAVCR